MILAKLSCILLFIYESSELLTSISEADLPALFAFGLSWAQALHHKDKP